MKEFELKDSGARESFNTGSMRDSQEGKLRFDLITPLSLRRLAAVYTKGDLKYPLPRRNWELGQDFSRVMASLQRHLHYYQMNDKSEDHLAQMVWNGMALLHYEEAIDIGLLPKELNDLPKYYLEKPDAK